MVNVQDVANCFLHLDEQSGGDGISNLKLQKLVYYAQGFFVALFGEPLFDNRISAWIHGPVVRDLYSKYKQHGSNPIPLPDDFEISSVPEKELDLIAEVFHAFGQFSAWKLRDMTHEEPTWQNHKRDPDDEIPLAEMEAYFKTQIY